MDTTNVKPSNLRVGVGKQVKGPNWNAYLVRVDSSGSWVGFEILLAEGGEDDIKRYAKRTVVALGASLHIEGEAVIDAAEVADRKVTHG